jgi:ATP-grasp domain, R2K clade family 3
MHWVVNTSLKREGGYESLIQQLERQGVSYTLVRKPPFADYLVGMEDDVPMMLDIEGPVFVTGTTSMNEVSKNHGWKPGYLDSPGIQECIEHWGEHMLNHDAIFGPIATIVPPEGGFFIRPDEDSKSFAGTIMHAEDFNNWRKDLMAIEGWTSIPPETIVMISTFKTIWSEYRCSVVNGRVVTASRYKTGRTVAYSSDVGDRIINFANDRVQEWNPRIAFTLDVADTPDGLKIIETNAISSSGFYALDMNIFVGEITKLGDRYAVNN